MRAAGRWSPGIACRGRRNLPRRGSWLLVGSHHTRIAGADRSTGRGCRLQSTKRCVRAPQAGQGERSDGARTTYLDGCFQLEQDGLVDENFPRLCAQILYLVLLELHGLAWAVASDWKTGGRGQETQSVAGPGDSSPSKRRSMTESRSISVVVSAIVTSSWIGS